MTESIWHKTPWECPTCDDGTEVEIQTHHPQASDGVAYHKDSWRCPNGHHGWVRVQREDYVELPTATAEA